MKNNTKQLVTAALIAAIYATLTLVFAPISFGLMQIRVSEALTVLPALTPVAVPGLFVGCLISNTIGAALGQTSLIDIMLGSLATLIAAAMSYKLREKKWWVPMPPVLVNAIIIGAQLKLLYVPEVPLIVCMGYVAAGQFVACYLLGMLLLLFASKEKDGIRAWDRWTNR